MTDIYQQALAAHKLWRGKIAVSSKASVSSKEDLSLAYTPGVAEPCRKIAEEKDLAYKYTWKGNAVAVVTDGTAVLGLGDIGPEASLPVMEGKAVLFKEFAGIDAVPICLDTKDPKEIIQIVKALAPGFGGINLEDISAPRCVDIERALIADLDIPVFHDDQHGTAIVVIAALINALKVVKKKPEEIKIVVSGTGAAGSSIIKMLANFGVKKIYAFDINGIVTKKKAKESGLLAIEIAELTDPEQLEFSLEEAFVGADVFIGVSAAGIVSEKMVASMASKAIVFAMANPEPEIQYDLAKKAGALIVGTGRSDYPNQINNVLAFPGIFKGAFLIRARQITENMKLAAAKGIASIISEEELSSDYIIPSVFHPDVVEVVSKAVAQAAVVEGVNRI